MASNQAVCLTIMFQASIAAQIEQLEEAENLQKVNFFLLKLGCLG
jgi:hypothetical protein